MRIQSKNLYIIFGTIAVIVAIIFLAIILTKKDTVNNPSVDLTNKLVIKTSSSDVIIPDITKNANINIPGGVLFIDESYYSISYFSVDQGFIITLKNSNLQKARDLAEADFLKQLNLDQISACNLKVTLNVPWSIGFDAAGVNYGLSFCSSSVALP